MEDILVIADLFLLPSETESFGLAAGVPIITTNVGGLSEINIPGETGFMADVGDIETMGKQAISILEDDAVLKQFKIRAAAYARNYDIHNIVPQYEALYNRFCKA